MKFSIQDFFSKCDQVRYMWPNPQFSTDLVTFTGRNPQWKTSFFVQWRFNNCHFPVLLQRKKPIFSIYTQCRLKSAIGFYVYGFRVWPFLQEMHQSGMPEGLFPMKKTFTTNIVRQKPCQTETSRDQTWWVSLLMFLDFSVESHQDLLFS